MAQRLHIEFCGQSDTGKVRSHNEDSIEIDPASGLAVLAGGMGGYNAGEVASKLAVRSVGFLVRQRLARLVEPAPEPDVTTPAPAGILLKESVQLANQRILKTASTRPEYRGMGTHRGRGAVPGEPRSCGPCGRLSPVSLPRGPAGAPHRRPLAAGRAGGARHVQRRGVDILSGPKQSRNPPGDAVSCSGFPE